MYIVVLGCGMEGSLVSRLLAEREEVTRIGIADMREDAAKKLASELGKKAIGRHVDARNSDDVAKVIEGADAVVDCVRACWQYGASNAKAAIKAGVNLTNLCDDADGALETLELDQEAQKAGVTIVPCNGLSPGLTCLHAKYGAGKLDRTDDIHHIWAVDSSQTGYMGTRHLDHCLSGKVLSYRDGEMVEVDPFTDREMVGLPHGRVEVYNVGHPEPVLLWRHIPGVRTITEKAGFVQNMNMAYQGLYEYGLTRSEPVVKINGLDMTPFDLLDAYRDAIPLEEKKKRWPSVFTDGIGVVQRIEVRGIKNGNPTRYVYYYEGMHYDLATAYPAVVMALMLARGEIKAKGVISPEGCLDVASFLSEMSKKGLGWTEISEEMRQL